MTAELHAFARPGAVGRPPLVPVKAVLRDGPKLMFDPDWLDTRWYRSCTPMQRMAGFALRVRSLGEQPAGSVPDDDVELAHLTDFGSDIEAWRAAKAKVMEGWVLCADERWYHPDVARNVLHIWLGRLDSRRVSAWANASKGREAGDYGLGSILDDVDEALAALRALDPQDAFLRKATKVAADWRKRVMEFLSLGTPPSGDGRCAAVVTPIRAPNGRPIQPPPEGSPKRSEAKPSESIPFGQSPNGAREDAAPASAWETEKRCDGPSQPAGDTPGEPAVEAYSPGAFHRFWEAWPNKVGLGAAERAFAKIQKSGQVGFGTLMAALERYKRCKPVDRPWCNPSTWLNQKRWLDEWPAEAGRPPGGTRLDRATAGVDSAVAGLDAVFARRRAPQLNPFGEIP